MYSQIYKGENVVLESTFFFYYSKRVEKDGGGFGLTRLKDYEEDNGLSDLKRVLEDSDRFSSKRSEEDRDVFFQKCYRNIVAFLVRKALSNNDVFRSNQAEAFLVRKR